MPQPTEHPAGRIEWIDWTVPDAHVIRDFYQAGMGWSVPPVAMDGYQDYCMLAADGTVAAGICHARGENRSFPPQWLIYVNVRDLDAAIAQVNAKEGVLLGAIREMPGYGRCIPIQDPAGAACML